MTGSDVGHAGVIQTFREMPLAARFALLGVFVNQLGAFLQLFLVLYLVHRGFSNEQAGIALGAYAVGAIVGTLFGGSLSDRLGPRWTIVIAMGCAALLTLSVTALTWFPLIVVVVALAGGMTQAGRPAVSALLFGLMPESRQVMTFAMYRTALNGGVIAGPLVATWLSTISWDLIFWFDAATTLAYCAIALFLIPRDHVPEEAEGAAAGESKRKYFTVLRDRKYVGYLSLMLGNGLVHVQYFAVLPLMLAAAGYATWAYGTATAISAVIVVGCELIVTRTTQTWPIWIAVIAGWLLLVIGRGAFGLPGGYTIIILGTVIAAIGQIVGGPSAFAYPAKVAPAGATGRYLGTAHATFQLGYAIGPIAGVLLFERFGHGFWAIVFIFGVLISIPGIWGMRRTLPAATPAGEPAAADRPAEVELPDLAAAPEPAVAEAVAAEELASESTKT